MPARRATISRASLIEGIADWIAVDNPARARSFVTELIERCMSLAHYAQRFPEVRRVGERSIRKFVHNGYLVLYVVTDRGVEISRVVHGSRDWARIIESL